MCVLCNEVSHTWTVGPFLYSGKVLVSEINHRTKFEQTAMQILSDKNTLISRQI